MFTNWVCSDPDSAQHLRKINDTCWDCYEIRGPYPPGCKVEYGVAHHVIDLDCYDEGDVLEYISWFGYSSREYVVEQYGKFAEQVIVECIFECLDDDFVFTGSEQECEAYILEQIDQK